MPQLITESRKLVLGLVSIVWVNIFIVSSISISGFMILLKSLLIYLFRVEDKNTNNSKSWSGNKN